MMRLPFLLLAGLAFSAELNAGECGYCQTLSLRGASIITPSIASFAWSQGEAETNKVDLLFVFDSSARMWLSENGWTEETFTVQVLSDMNCGIAMTGLNSYFSFRLAGRHDIEADLSELTLLNLCRYSSKATRKAFWEPYFLPMRAFREEIAADIVIVLTAPESDTYYGIATEFTSGFLSSAEMSTLADYAYCAIDIRSTFARHTVLHEVGHIFGAGHSDAQQSSPGPLLFSYSSGYNYAVNGKEYATVMAYLKKEANGDYVNVRLPFFSSPDYLHDGVPVGTANNDNTRTLRETYPLVANFRVKTYMPGYRPAEDDTIVSDLDFDDISLDIRDVNGYVIGNGDTISLCQFENIALPVNAECWTGEKVTIKAKGLPSGLKYSSKTGTISGRPKKAGTFAVSVAAKAKGMAENVCTFTVSVSALPDAVIGSYAGIMSSSGNGDALATAVVHKTGRIVVKFNFEGRTRTFSCQGFSGGGKNTWAAEPSVRIGKATHTLNMVFDSASRSVSFDGYSGMLLQNTWGRKDISAPVFKKAVKNDVGDFKMRLYGKGKVRISGVIDGARASGTFQLVAGTPSGGYQKDVWSLPVVFPAKRNFQGWANWFAVDLTVDASNRVAGGDVEALGSNDL